MNKLALKEKAADPAIEEIVMLKWQIELEGDREILWARPLGGGMLELQNESVIDSKKYYLGALVFEGSGKVIRTYTARQLAEHLANLSLAGYKSDDLHITKRK